MRIVFMGTPEFSVPVLEALSRAHDVAAVYTQPPRPAGRGKKLRPSPVQITAEGLGIDVRHPKTLRPPEAQAAFAALQVDVAVVVAYGLILPQAILDAPARGCLNIHASLLPRWRGAAPIHRAIMAGDAETGVCIMQMEAGLDTGPVLLRAATPIGPTETTGDLHDRLSAMGADLVGQALARLDALPPQAQPDAGVTYAEKINKVEAAVTFADPAQTLARKINGLSPFPGAYTLVAGQRLKLLRARALPGTSVPGRVQAQAGLVIGTGDGLLQVLEVQPAGRGPMDAAEWRRGARVAPGDTLEG